jgi:Rrf2 family iron-sulfur cluster assembly transcriptional regulator
MYAWKALAYLAAHQEAGRVLGSAIAEAVCVSYGVITPILRLLKAAGLVDSTKAGWGGYSLAKKATDIALLDVVEALRGPLRRPPAEESPEATVHGRRLQPAWDEAVEAMRCQLRKVRLADFQDQEEGIG